jgi:hypothetical protein
MKTVTELQTMVANEPKPRKRDHLRELIAYLQSKPSESYLIREKQRLISQIKIAGGGGYEKWLKQQDTVIQQRGGRREFNKESGITRLRRQLDNINFLIGT